MWRVSCERNRALTARYGMKLWVEFRLILALIRAVNIGGNYSPTLQSGSPFRSEISPCEICGGQSGTETLLSVSTSIFPCRHHSIKAPCMYWSKCCSNREDNWRKPEQFRKNVAVSEIGEHSIEKYFDLVSEGLNSFCCFVRTFSHTTVARSHAMLNATLKPLLCCSQTLTFVGIRLD
jgi:hypothetical protein